MKTKNGSSNSQTTASRTLECSTIGAKRSELGVSDDAVVQKFVLDYDNGAHRADVEKQFEEFSYIIYNSTGNSASQGIEKFRVILDLKEPVKAYDLTWWMNKKAFIDYFNGVDKTTFYRARFFYRASKYDADGDQVVISKHNGKPFDFYASFHRVFQPFEELKQKMAEEAYRKPKQDVKKMLDVFIKWAEDKYPAGTHYADICAFCRRAVSCGLDEMEAEAKFTEMYAGHSKWTPNFREVFYRIERS